LNFLGGDCSLSQDASTWNEPASRAPVDMARDWLFSMRKVRSSLGQYPANGRRHTERPRP
jgi:hypothetical protein